MFNSRFHIISGAIFALTSLISAGSATAAIPLGVAQTFGVLGGATVTNTGPTVVNGNLGVSPGAAVVGFPPGTVALGTIHAADAVALQAQSDLVTAYNVAAGLPCNTDLTGQNLGGLTLTPGVYCFNTSAQLTGTLTLDVQNNPNAQFVFKTGSTLTTASGSTVMAINGSSCDKVYWQVGTSATLGTGSTFAGDILALSSITVTTGTNTTGRALARNGAVTLDTNNVNTCALIAAPTLSTNASPNILLGGGQLSDSATVSGRINPVVGASITFRLYGPNDATCGNPPVFTSAAVPYPIAGGAVTSAGFTPTVIGTYRWIAAYSGDGNNPPITGICNAPNESAIVSNGILATPTLATIALPPNVLLGAAISDSATVTGRVNPVAGATVTFTLYGPNDATCTNPAIFISAVNYPIAGGSVSSPSFTPTLAGTYRWIANYSGDANNAAVAAPCNAPNENVIVSAAVLPVPTIATTASPNIFPGGSLTDNATVSGRINPVVGATITFRLFGSADPTCTSAPIFASIVAYPVAGGSVTSSAFMPATPGTYRWIASYSGDVNNAPVTAPCNAPNESVVVAAASAQALGIPTLSPFLLLLLVAALPVLGWRTARRRISSLQTRVSPPTR